MFLTCSGPLSDFRFGLGAQNGVIFNMILMVFNFENVYFYFFVCDDSGTSLLKTTIPWGIRDWLISRAFKIAPAGFACALTSLS